MDASMFEKFNQMFDVEELQQEVEQSSAPMEYVDVPHGKYEVSVANMEMGLTSEKAANPGKPMLKIRFRIVAGEYKGQSIFYNQPLLKGFAIYNSKLMLESLSEQEVVFKDYVQYAELIDSIFSKLQEEHAEFALKYYEEKDWDRFEILEKF